MDSPELVAPVECDQGHIFDTIDDPNDVVLDYSTTIASPKKYFLPPREVLFKFDVAQNDVDAYELDVKPRVLFGVHPCDMNAIEKLDSVFLEGPYPDPYYRARREATLIVGVGCTPSQSCFCHRMDADEAPAGCDLFLQDLGDRFWSPHFFGRSGGSWKNRPTLREATDEDRAAFAAAARRRNEAFSSDIPFVQDVAMLMDVSLSPFWAELGSALSELHRVRRCPIRNSTSSTSLPSTARPASVCASGIAVRIPSSQPLQAVIISARANASYVTPSYPSKTQWLQGKARQHALRRLRSLRRCMQNRHQPD